MKKLIIFVLTLVSFNSFSQCSEVIQTKEDKFSGDVTTSNKSILTIKLTDGGLADIFIIRDKNKDVMMAFSVSKTKFGCTDETSKVYFLFTDDTRYMIQVRGGLKCDNTIILFITGSVEDEKLGDLLNSKTIKSVRLQGMTTTIDFDIDSDKANDINRIFSCMKMML